MFDLVEKWLSDECDRLQAKKNLLKRIELLHRSFVRGNVEDERRKDAKKLYELVKDYFNIYVSNIGSPEWVMCETINNEIEEYLK